MQYMLLIYANEQVWTEAERAKCYAESTELVHELRSNRQCLGALPLHPVETATNVQVREGRRIVKDGPFAETREQLGGFFLIAWTTTDAGLPDRKYTIVRRGNAHWRPAREASKRVSVRRDSALDGLHRRG